MWGCLCKGLNVNCGSNRQDVFCLADWNSNVLKRSIVRPYINTGIGGN